MDSVVTVTADHDVTCVAKATSLPIIARRPLTRSMRETFATQLAADRPSATYAVDTPPFHKRRVTAETLQKAKEMLRNFLTSLERDTMKPGSTDIDKHTIGVYSMTLPTVFDRQWPSSHRALMLSYVTKYLTQRTRQMALFMKDVITLDILTFAEAILTAEHFRFLSKQPMRARSCAQHRRVLFKALQLIRLIAWGSRQYFMRKIRVLSVPECDEGMSFANFQRGLQRAQLSVKILKTTSTRTMAERGRCLKHLALARQTMSFIVSYDSRMSCFTDSDDTSEQIDKSTRSESFNAQHEPVRCPACSQSLCDEDDVWLRQLEEDFQNFESYERSLAPTPVDRHEHELLARLSVCPHHDVAMTNPKKPKEVLWPAPCTYRSPTFLNKTCEIDFLCAFAEELVAQTKLCTRQTGSSDQEQKTPEESR